MFMSDVDEVGVEEAAGDEPVPLAGGHADLLPGDEEALAEEAVVEDHRWPGLRARSRCTATKMTRLMAMST